MSEFLFSFQTN